MSILTLATTDDFDRLDALVAAFHAETGFESTPEFRAQTLMPILEGMPFAVAYLIGPRRAPVGYIVISFGYSIEFGGIDGFIDEFFIRERVRGRGMGTEVLLSLLPALEQNGLKALHLEVETGNHSARRLYQKAGFKLRENYHLMTREA